MPEREISPEIESAFPKEAEIFIRFEWGDRPEAKSALLFAIYGNQETIRAKLAEIKTRRLDLSEDQLKAFNLATEACRDLGIDRSGSTAQSRESLLQPELFPIHRVWETAMVQTINLGTEKGPDTREVLHLTGSLRKYLAIPDQSDPQLELAAEKINYLTSILIQGKTGTKDTPFSVAIPLGPSGAGELNNLFAKYPKLEKKLRSADGITRKELEKGKRKFPTPEEMNVATAASVIWGKVAKRAAVFAHGFGGNSRSRTLIPLLSRPAEMGQRPHNEVVVFPSLMGADDSLANDFPPLSPNGKMESVYPFTPAMEAAQLTFFLETTGLLRFAIDKHRLTLAGHSMGGLAALLAGAELAATYGERLKLNLSVHDPCTPGSQTFTEGLEGTLVRVGARLRHHLPATVGAIAEPLNVHFNPLAREAAAIHGENFVASEYGPAILHQLLGIDANEINPETVAKIRRAVEMYPTIIHLAKHSRMLDFAKQFATLRSLGLLALVQIIEKDASDHFTQVAPKVKDTIPLEAILTELPPQIAVRLLVILATAGFRQPDDKEFHTLFPRLALPSDHTWNYLADDPTAEENSLSLPENAIDKSDLLTLLARDPLFAPLVANDQLDAFFGKLKAAISPLLSQTTFIGAKESYVPPPPRQPVLGIPRG